MHDCLRRNPYLINTLSRHFGGKHLYEIRELNIEQYKKIRLEAGVKHATIKREPALLRSILNKVKVLGYNCCKSVPCGNNSVVEYDLANGPGPFFADPHYTSESAV